MPSNTDIPKVKQVKSEILTLTEFIILVLQRGNVIKETEIL